MPYYCPPKQKHIGDITFEEQEDNTVPKEIIGVTADSPGELVERERRRRREVGISLVSKQNPSTFLVPLSPLPVSVRLIF